MTNTNINTNKEFKLKITGRAVIKVTAFDFDGNKGYSKNVEVQTSQDTLVGKIEYKKRIPFLMLDTKQEELGILTPTKEQDIIIDIKEGYLATDASKKTHIALVDFVVVR